MALRRELQRITYHVRDPGEHPPLIDALRATFAHEIRLVEPADQVRRYNCVMHALDVADPPPIIVDLATREDFAPTPEFVGYMIAARLLHKVERDAATTGDLVVYSLHRKIEHIGLIDGDQVLSKWGRGNLWRHPLLEVPSRYGSSIRRFRPVTREVVVPTFIAFARAKIGDARVERSIQRSGFLRPA